MKTITRALTGITLGACAFLVSPSLGLAQSQEQLANSVRCQVPFSTASSPDVAALQECVSQMRAKGQVTGVEVHSAPTADAATTDSRRALNRSSLVASRIALEFPTAVVVTKAPVSSTSASSASTPAETATGTQRFGMVDVVGYVTAAPAVAVVEPAPQAEPVEVLVPTIPSFDSAPRRVNPNPGEDLGIGRLGEEIDPDDDLEVVDDFKYRDSFLNGPANPDFGITVNIDDTAV